MDLRAKLTILADAAKYDASCASSGVRRRAGEGGIGSAEGSGICHSYTPDGRCVSLLKILLTNHCIFDCQYCVNRVSSDVRRARFTVEEVVRLTMSFYKRNYIEGLFLSSGVIQSADYTMGELTSVARTLREREKYFGYIHLKAVPGASAAALAEAGRWADRLSANIELPTQGDLDRFAPEKKVATVERTMGEIRSMRDGAVEERRKFAPAGQSTQMIVGATASPDAVILETAAGLYGRHKLRRVYYSAYSPIPYADSRLPFKSPPMVREHRLYQADWLMRFYGFRVGELTNAEEPNLDLEVDPKMGWALRHRHFFPVDLNRAEKWRILRVPGIGARNAERIVRLRRVRRIRMEDLGKLRVSVGKVGPFVVVEGHNPEVMRLDRGDLRERVKGGGQMELFAASESAVTGEV